eukprot:gene25259-30503_t
MTSLTVVSIVDLKSLMACMFRIQSIVIGTGDARAVSFATLVVEDPSRNFTLQVVQSLLVPCFQGRSGPFLFAKHFNLSSALVQRALKGLPRDVFLNSGVYLLDADLWRQRNLTARAERLLMLQRRHGLFSAPSVSDQGLFTLLLLLLLLPPPSDDHDDRDTMPLSQLPIRFNLRRLPRRTTALLAENVTGVVHFAGMFPGADALFLCRYPLHYPVTWTHALPLFLSAALSLHRQPACSALRAWPMTDNATGGVRNSSHAAEDSWGGLCERGAIAALAQLALSVSLCRRVHRMSLFASTMENINVRENIHPNLDEVPTAEQIVQLMEYNAVNKSRRLLGAPQVTAEVIAQGEAEEIQAVVRRAEGNVTPLWFAPAMQAVLQAALHPIEVRIAAMQLDIAILCARQTNTEARTFNRAENNLLRPLVRGYRNHLVQPVRNPEDPPLVFPENKTMVIDLTHAQLNHFADFYNVAFGGDTIAARRMSFLNFVTLV